MRTTVLALAALLAAAPAVLAQDPPPDTPPKVPDAPALPARPEAETPAPAPSRHENKVSPEARGAWEAMSKVLYDPVALGLKELKGKMVMKMEMAGMEDMGDMEGMEGMPEMKMDITIDFKAPKSVEVGVSTDNPMLSQAVDQIKSQVKSQFLAGTGVMEPPADQEYDASLEDKEGVKVLVIRNYLKNEPQGETRMTLGAHGLPASGVITQTDPNTGMEMSMDIAFHYSEEGKRFRMERMVIQHPMFPEPMETAMAYTDAGAFKVLTGMNTKGPMGMNFVFQYTELTVNGTKFDLPVAKKPAPGEAEGTKTEPAGAPPPADGPKEEESKEEEPEAEAPK